MDIDSIKNIYFLGIGGIGMSSLARYFLSQNKTVGGYDKTSTPLTESLTIQGIHVHYSDDIALIPANFLDKKDTLIVRTPAVPEDHDEYNFFLRAGFTIMKRAQVLGILFNAHRGIAIAGTHGKTSVTTFTSFMLRECGIDCSAFLGGISKNYHTNLLLGKSDYVVAEADEFDRSFLQLFPYVLLITTIDADHLDIYEDLDDIRGTFSLFASQTHENGILILKEGVEIPLPKNRKVYRYSLENKSTDFFASDIEVCNGAYLFSFNTPDGKTDGFVIKVPGRINIENAIAAMSVSWALGISPEKMKLVIPDLKGVVRRFDIHYQKGNCVYIDDYAHHPRELDAVISSMRDLYRGRKITGIFQPHLYSRTRDFADEFAESLSQLDELILLDIYPAREKPIPGVTSEVLLSKIEGPVKHHCSKLNLLNTLKELNIEVLLTVGAGDIDQLIEPVKQFLVEREKN